MKSSIVFVLLILLAITTQARWKKTTAFNGGNINSLIASDNTIYASTENGVFVTTNNGANWTEKNNGLINLSVNSIAIKGKYIFAGTNGGVFLSTNKGDSWSAVLTKEGESTISISSLAMTDGTIFAVTSWKGIYASKDNGLNWKVINSGLTSLSMTSISVGNKNIFVGTYDKGIFRSTNNGDSWDATSSGLTDTYILTITANGDSVFAGTLFSGIFLSTDEGVNWKQINNGLTRNSIRSIAVRGSNVFAAAYGGDGGGTFQSEDYGATWKSINDGLSEWKMTALCITSDNVFVGDRYGRVFIQATSNLITSVNESTINPTESISLEQNFPNPFFGSTIINYHVSSSEVSENITLKVYDILGNELKTLVNNIMAPGHYNVNYNATSLPTGIYYYKLSSGNYSRTKKMVLRK